MDAVLTSLAARALPGIDGARVSFFAPHDRFIGFSAAGEPRRIVEP